MRSLLDNNVVLDFLLNRNPFDVEAKEIFLLAANRKIEIFVASITAVNAFYTIRKDKGKDIAFGAINGLINLVNVCRTNRYILRDALSLDFSDYEDAVQCASAVAEGLDAIVTRNTKDFANSPIPVYSPSEFLAFLQKQLVS